MTESRDPNRFSTTDGRPPHPEYSTADSPAPQPVDPSTGQHRAYWVLSEQERAKGFVRPIRTSYVHRGIRPKGPLRDLTPDEAIRYADYGYIGFERYYGTQNSSLVGRFWTQADLDSGCGGVTTMATALAETYAREPKFYGSTFCCHCKNHFPVREFVWDGTDEVVGS